MYVHIWICTMPTTPSDCYLSIRSFLRTFHPAGYDVTKLTILRPIRQGPLIRHHKRTLRCKNSNLWRSPSSKSKLVYSDRLPFICPKMWKSEFISCNPLSGKLEICPIDISHVIISTHSIFRNHKWEMADREWQSKWPLPYELKCRR